MAYELAKRTADAEQKLATRDGLPARDGALLSARLQRRYQDRITGSFAIPGREGRYAPLPDSVPPALAAALKARGIEQLYSHQAEAWEASQRGEHVAIVTPTASGKSDRKSTRLNSSHSQISYAVFCLKKKKKPSLIRVLDNVVNINGLSFYKVTRSQRSLSRRVIVASLYT